MLDHFGSFPFCPLPANLRYEVITSDLNQVICAEINVKTMYFCVKSYSSHQCYINLHLYFYMICIYVHNQIHIIWLICIYIYQHPQRGANWILKFKTYKGCPLDTPYKQQVLYTNIIHNPVPSPFYPTNRFRLDPPHVLLRPSSRSRLLSGQVGRNEGMTGEARALGGNQNLTYD